jgi:hypothetical protein
MSGLKLAAARRFAAARWLAAAKQPGPSQEFSHTDLSSAEVWCFPGFQNCSIKRTH